VSTSSCETFRAELERALRGAGRRGRSGAGDLASLGWDGHVLACEACRELLAAEEALEALLATLPEPALPPALARRVLARLERERTAGSLDRLLELDAAAPAVPSGLAERVRAGARAAASAGGSGLEPGDARLDALLDAVPAPGVPAGLAAGILERLEAVRRAPAPIRRSRRRSKRRALPLAAALAAAGLALVLGYGWLRGTGGGEDGPAPTEGPDVAQRPERAGGATRREPPDPGPEVRRADRGGAATADALPRDASPVADGRDASPAAAPDEELLAALDVLESWEFLAGEDLELFLASIDETDQLLFAFESELAGSGDTAGESGG